MSRYSTASLVSAGLIGGLFLFRWIARVIVDAEIRKLGAPVPPVADFGTELPGWALNLVAIADLVARFQIVLIPLILMICFGLAAAGKSPQPQQPQ